MNWLLLPEDEVELVGFVTDELGLTLILGRGWDRDGLPVRFGSQPREIVWWASEIGPIARMGDAPPPTDAKDAVMQRLNQEADPDGWVDYVDSGRTPVIRFHRANWNQNGCLNPGLLQGMSVRVKDQPPELTRTLRRIERWLKSDGEKINPFRYTIKTPVPEPARLGALTAWARPHALTGSDQAGRSGPGTADIPLLCAFSAARRVTTGHDAFMLDDEDPEAYFQRRGFDIATDERVLHAEYVAKGEPGRASFFRAGGGVHLRSPRPRWRRRRSRLRPW